MPTYEFRCNDCGNIVEVFATVSEKEKGIEVICEKCGGNKVIQAFGGISVQVGRSKSVPLMRSGCGGGGCCG